MSYLSEVLADSPLAYYRLGDTAQPFPSDCSGSSLTQVIGYTRVAGPLASSFGASLDGTSQYFTSSYNINASKFTIEAWVKTTDTAGIIADNRGVAGKSLTLAMGPAPVSGGGSGKIWFGLCADSIAIGVATNSTFNDGAWHHIVGVWDGTSGAAFATSQLTVYVDGTAVAVTATGAAGSQNAPLVGTGGYQFGNNSNNTSGFGMLTGSLSRIALYSGTALTSTRVSAHFAATTVSGYTSAVLADSPAQYWTFDQNVPSLTNMADSSGNGHDGTYTTTVALGATGALSSDTDTAVTFNGSNTVADVPYASWAALTTALTIEAWVKTTATGIRTIADRDAGSSRIFQFRQNSGSLELVKIASGVVTASQATSINDGAWHHVVATYDGSNIRLYKDGSLINTTAASGSLAGTDALSIGYSLGSTGRWNGQIDEVAYYNTTLSGARIAAHYTAGTAVSTGASGSGSLSLSASGAAKAAATGTGALALAGSGNAGIGASGSGALALSGAGVIDFQPASGSGSLALSAAGGVGAGVAGTASLTIAGTGTAVGATAASGSGSITLSAAGSATLAASGTASLTLGAIGTAFALFVTDLTNALNGRRRRARGTATVTRAAAPPPPGRTFAKRYDKAIAYPIPDMVDGRPE